MNKKEKPEEKEGKQLLENKIKYIENELPINNEELENLKKENTKL
jgi:hypothetical protein